MDKVKRVASENGVVIFSKSSCCLCYTVNILCQELGITPLIYEIDQDPDWNEMEKAMMKLGWTAPYPAALIGGKRMGPPNGVVSLHLWGNWTPLSKPY